MDYLQEVIKYKLEMKDLNEDSDLSLYDMVQPKLDGWWTMIVIKDGQASVITSGGDVRCNFYIESRDAILLAEWMYGTNWSQNSVYKGRFFLFDILEYDNKKVIENCYIERLGILHEHFKHFEPQLSIVRTDHVSEWKYWWNHYVEEHDFEGLVFKNSNKTYFNSQLGRMKKVVTMDYIVMGFKEGTKRLEGTLGALEGGLIVDGNLVRICTVGGGFTDSDRDEIWFNKEQYIGRVFEARGKVLFSSGALRHPAFTRFRDDKSPEVCIFKKG